MPSLFGALYDLFGILSRIFLSISVSTEMQLSNIHLSYRNIISNRMDINVCI